MPVSKTRLLKPRPCPWCGKRPRVIPEFPEETGNAWGEVLCENDRCAAQPSVSDGAQVADERGSIAYRNAAIIRWNKWGRK